MDDSVRPHHLLHAMSSRASEEGAGIPVGAHGERPRLAVVRATPSPFRLAWHERRVSSAVPGRYRIRAPVHGGPIPPDADAVLTRLLEQWWVRADAAPSSMHPTITSVVASLGRSVVGGRGDQGVLTLLLTAENVGDGERVHGAGMGRQLRRALAQLGNDA